MSGRRACSSSSGSRTPTVDHSAEDSADGPMLSFLGLANETYYMFAGDGTYPNYRGVWNPLNVKSPIVRRLILDSLGYWACEVHVDGFRFDLAGATNASRILVAIKANAVLRDVKLIAEPWGDPETHTYRIQTNSKNDDTRSRTSLPTIQGQAGASMIERT